MLKEASVKVLKEAAVKDGVRKEGAGGPLSSQRGSGERESSKAAPSQRASGKLKGPPAPSQRPLSSQRGSGDRGSPKRGTAFGERENAKRGRAFER